MLVQVLLIFCCVRFSNSGAGGSYVLVAFILVVLCLIFGLFFYCTRLKASLTYQIGWGIMAGSLCTIALVAILLFWVARHYTYFKVGFLLIRVHQLPFLLLVLVINYLSGFQSTAIIRVAPSAVLVGSV